jgi:hypothetical protein
VATVASEVLNTIGGDAHNYRWSPLERDTVRVLLSGWCAGPHKMIWPMRQISGSLGRAGEGVFSRSPVTCGILDGGELSAISMSIIGSITTVRDLLYAVVSTLTAQAKRGLLGDMIGVTNDQGWFSGDDSDTQLEARHENAESLLLLVRGLNRPTAFFAGIGERSVTYRVRVASGRSHRSFG